MFLEHHPYLFLALQLVFSFLTGWFFLGDIQDDCEYAAGCLYRDMDGW
jgi:hypothetical protein